MTEQQAIEQLKNYKRLVARIQVLSSYSVGMGITVSRLNEDDQLQELHRQLRSLPSYIYLNNQEQKLETLANAYLAYLVPHPAGTRAQKKAIPKSGASEEEEKMLRDLRRRIQKVIEARGWDWPDDVFDEALKRVVELQELQEEKQRIDTAMQALESYKQQYADLLKVHYIEEKTLDEVALVLGVTERTVYRWKNKALKEFIKMSG